LALPAQREGRRSRACGTAFLVFNAILASPGFTAPRWSKKQTVSCASCHDPEKGWSDGRPYSLDHEGLATPRHAPIPMVGAVDPIGFGLVAQHAARRECYPPVQSQRGTGRQAAGITYRNGERRISRRGGTVERRESYRGALVARTAGRRQGIGRRSGAVRGAWAFGHRPGDGGDTQGAAAGAAPLRRSAEGCASEIHSRFRGAQSHSGRLGCQRLYGSWRVVVVRGASFRPLSQRSPLRGQDTEGRASGQSAGRAAHSVRTRDQSADSPRAGTYHLPAPPDMLDGVLRAVKAFIASAPQSDDIAALACRWKP
jgi:hypothetical protein